jgi:hypothetical protein
MVGEESGSYPHNIHEKPVQLLCSWVISQPLRGCPTEYILAASGTLKVFGPNQQLQQTGPAFRLSVLFCLSGRPGC